MPFGIANAPYCFGCLMEDVLRGYQCDIYLIYMDDVIVRSATLSYSIAWLELVCQRLSEANLKLKPAKCISTTCEVLGTYRVWRGRKYKILAVKNWSTPKNAEQVQSFPSLCAYYRRFVQDFAEVSRPLRKICEKGNKFIWSDYCQESFLALKEALTTAPVRSLYLVSSLYWTRMQVNILWEQSSHKQVGQKRIKAYMNMVMNSHEQAYCVTR